MNKMRFKKILSLILIAAMIMTFAVGCSPKETASTEAVAPDVKSFTLTVTDREGAETTFNISTERKTVGEALLDEGLIEGTEGQYGLYVTKVNGVEAIYENDGTYWSFYINGEYATSGVDTTDVEDGAQYGFKVEGN